MTGIQRDYRAKFFKPQGDWADAQTPELDFTLNAELTDVGEAGGQRTYPSEGRVETSGWQIGVVDDGETLTSKMATSDGRVDLVGRLLRLEKKDDSGSWKTLATGRINDIDLGDNVSFYEVSVHDETQRSRNVEIFKGQNTTRLYPPCADVDWRRFGPDSVLATWEVTSTSTIDLDGTTRDTVTLEVKHAATPVTSAHKGAAEDDVDEEKTGSNRIPFRFLSWQHALQNNSEDYRVLYFGESNLQDPVAGLKVNKNEDQNSNFKKVRLVWDNHGKSEGDELPGFLHFPGKDPDNQFPLHIGGKEGLTVGKVLENLFTGKWQAGSDKTELLYDQSAVDALKTGAAGPKITIRATSPMTMEAFLEKHIYRPYGIIPFVNENGRITPKKVFPPDKGDIADVTSLFKFTESNSGNTSVWQIEGSDQVTRVRALDTEYRSPKESVGRQSWAPGASTSGEGRLEESTESFDGIESEEVAEEFDADNIADVGIKERAYDYTYAYNETSTGSGFRRNYAESVFQMFRDGPIRVTADGFTEAEDESVGDYVLVDKAYLPNPKTQSRGGSRLFQIVNKVHTPTGPQFELLDVGPESQPLNAPTISVAQNADRPRHAIDVTLDSLDADAVGAQIMTAVADSEPAEDSDLWEFREFIESQGTTVTISPNPADSTIWVRARATSADRIHSDWSTVVSVTTGTLPGVSSLTVSDISGNEALLTWGNSDSEYEVRILLGGSVEDTLQPGAEAYRLEGLDPNTTYTPTVELGDGFEGTGSSASLTSGGNGDGTFTTDASADKLATPLGIHFVAGEKV